MPAAPAAAQNAVDQQQTVRNVLFVPNVPQYFGQSFRPSSGNVSGLGYSLRASTAGTIQYYLFDRIPDAAGAVQLATATASFGADVDGFVDVFFTPVAVTPGTTYFITAILRSGFALFGAGGPSPVNGVVNPYADGQAYDGGTGASPTAGPYTTGSFGNTDLTFRTYTNTALATVPEPSTYALLATGLAGVGAVARRRGVPTA